MSSLSASTSVTLKAFDQMISLENIKKKKLESGDSWSCANDSNKGGRPLSFSARITGFIRYSRHSYTNQSESNESTFTDWLWAELAVEQKAEASIDTPISRNAQIQTSCGMILGMSTGFVWISAGCSCNFDPWEFNDLIWFDHSSCNFVLFRSKISYMLLRFWCFYPFLGVQIVGFEISWLAFWVLTQLFVITHHICFTLA